MINIQMVMITSNMIPILLGEKYKWGRIVEDVGDFTSDFLFEKIVIAGGASL